MINPNHKSIHYGRVTKLSRGHNGSLNVTVVLVTGQTVEELGFIYHNSLKAGDDVVVTIGFSIMSDRYGIKAIRRSKLVSKLRMFKEQVESITHADVVAFRKNKAGA